MSCWPHRLTHIVSNVKMSSLWSTLIFVALKSDLLRSNQIATTDSMSAIEGGSGREADRTERANEDVNGYGKAGPEIDQCADCGLPMQKIKEIFDFRSWHTEAETDNPAVVSACHTFLALHFD